MEKISPALLTFLFNATWLVALIACVASAAARLLRAAPARYRHVFWVAALLLALVAPLGKSVRWPRSRQPALTTTAHTNPPVAAKTESVDETALAVSPGGWQRSAVQPVRWPADFAVPVRLAFPLIVVYAGFVLFRVAGLLRAWRSTRALVRSSTEIQLGGTVERVIARCLERTQAGRVRFLSSEGIATPLTVGASPAIVVLPRQLLCEADEALLTSAVGHELVHVRNRDYTLNLLYRLLYIPLSFHPAAALIKRRIDETRELRCDEVVTDRLLSPAAYARSLVALAGAAHAFRRPGTVAVGIADADILEERIMSMLKKPHISSARRALLLAGAALVLAAPCIAAAPYALHFNLEQPANPAVTTSIIAPAAPVAASVAAEPAPAAPAQQEQKPVTNMKTVTVNGENVAVAFTTSEQEQSGGESAARMKRKLEEGPFKTRDDRELTPEERAAREKLLVEKLAMRAKMLAELSKAAKITMQQAIEAALRQQQGTVMESSLVGERRFITRQPDGTFTENTMGPPNAMYRVVILSGDDNAPVRTVVLVSATDGTILRTAVE